VDFRYSEEQLALQDTLQRLISRDYDFERRRSLARSPLGYSAEAWDRYAELGLLALPFPEEFGGIGGNGIDIMVVMEQVGQGLLLEPYWSTVVLCGGLIRDAASDSIKKALLPQIAAGKLQIALAAYESAGRYELAHVACTAHRSGSGWRLTGRKAVVLDAPSADYFLVSARSSGHVTDAKGISLFLVRRDDPGLTLFAYPTQSGGRAADLQLADVAVDSAAMIGVPEQALSIIERAVDVGLAALCSEASGIVTALNQATLSYLKTRKQFAFLSALSRRYNIAWRRCSLPRNRFARWRSLPPSTAIPMMLRRVAAHYPAPKHTSDKPRASSASRPCSYMAPWG